MKPKLTIYFTADTHGYLYPSNFCDEQPHALGLLSMRFPKDGNTLVIDGGDTLQGSPLTYFCHVTGRRSPVPQALNDRGYDYVTLGNHDFNYGPVALMAYLERLDARCLCANVRDAQGRLPILPCTVHTLENGLRVGLVGIVTDWVNRWEKPENLQDLTISDPLEAARAAIREMGDYDVLVGIYHGGIERDLASGRLLTDTDENIACRLCEELPFDLLLTGHQHIALANGSWHGTHIVQTPANGASYIRVTMDDEGRFSSALCPAGEKALLTSAERQTWQALNAWLDTPVGHLSRAIWPEEHLRMALTGSAIADLFNQVQLDASGAQVSCTALANQVRGFDSTVTVRDVVASYVYNNTLVVLEVTGEILRRGLERSAAYFALDANGAPCISSDFLLPKEEHYNYDYFAGITYAIDLRRPIGQRVTELRYDGEPVLPDQRLTLCMCDYRATGAGQYDFYLSCPRLREIQTGISEMILDYLRQQDVVQIPEEHPYSVQF